MAACRTALPFVSVLILAHFGSSMAGTDAEGNDKLKAEQLAKVWLEAPRRSGLAEGTREARGTLSLLQTDATLVKPRATTLIRNSGVHHDALSMEALHKVTEKSFAGVVKEADALRADVNDFQHGMTESFTGLQNKCKQDLETQHDANMNLAQSNAYSAEAMKSIARDIRHLQRSAEKVQDDVKAVEEQLRRLTENITIGSTFIDQALLESHQRMKAGKELKALAELDKKFNAATTAREKKQAQKQARHRSRSVHGPQTSLLQFDEGDSPDGHDGHETLVSELVDKLVTLNEQGEEEQEALLTLCRTGIEQGIAQHKALTEEQAAIKERMKLRNDLKDRLGVALQHLTANLKRLQQRHRSLAIFAKVVGDRALAPDKKTGALMMGKKQASNQAEYESSFKQKQQEDLNTAQKGVAKIQGGAAAKHT